MLEIDCPYDDLTLRLAVISLGDKFTEDIQKNLLSKLEVNKPITKNVVAEFHGITLEQLINSPNYEILLNEHRESIVKNFLKVVKNEGCFSDQEAWALLILATNPSLLS